MDWIFFYYDEYAMGKHAYTKTLSSELLLFIYYVLFLYLRWYGTLDVVTYYLSK